MKANCWVVVNCGESPDFGGTYETREDVYAHYEQYDSFTQRTYTSLRNANREMNRLDSELPDGSTCYVVCGVRCKELERGYNGRNW